jgi:hypothetical protein
MMSGSQQEALFHDPGEFSAAIILKRRADTPTATFLAAASALVGLTQLRGTAGSGFPPNLHILLGLRPDLLREDDLWEAVSSTVADKTVFPEGGPFVDSGGDAFVQIAATTAGDRAMGLRIVREVFSAVADVSADDEVLGQRLLNGQENFGFRDGGVLQRQEVLERLGPSARGTWLLHQQFAQDVNTFTRLPAQGRVEIMGRVPSNLFGRAPDAAQLRIRADLHAQADTQKDGHYQRMVRNPLAMVRRGFPYQSYANDGLVFIAASPRPEIFREALGRMFPGTGSTDKLLSYVAPLKGGLYFCPEMEWGQPIASELPGSTLPLRHDVPLVSYTTSEAFIQWMITLKRLGAFESAPLNQAAQQAQNPLGLRARLRRSDLQPHLDKIYETLSFKAEEAAELKEMQAAAEESAGEINEAIDDYITFN